MAVSFVAEFNSLPLDALVKRSLSTGSAAVREAAGKTRPSLADFAALISPAGSEILETLGRRAHQMTQQRFGKVIRLFAPLYLSNECINNCTYCGFSRDNPILRVTLSLDEVRREALLGRADILAALSDYAAAQADLQLEIARQYPDVHLSPGYEFDQGDNKWSLGLTVELPVLNRNQGPIAEAAARRAAAAARFNALQAKVLADIDTAAAGYRATEKGLAAIQELAGAQAAARDAVAAQVSAGAAAPLDLLCAQLELAEAEEARLEARVKRQQSLAALEDAVQRPIEMITPGVIERNPAAAKENKP